VAQLTDRIQESVDQMIPGKGFISWEEVASILWDSSLAGPLLLEVIITHSAEKDIGRFLQLAYARGCELYDQVFA
jgi:hypothetical protein